MKDMQKFKNVIHPSLLRGQPGCSVLSAVPPPELHLLMGAVNWGLEQLYWLMPEDQLKDRMRTWSKGISVRGYQGGGLDGVNSNLFLKHLDFLLFSVPVEAQPVKDMLASLKVVVQGCFGTELSPTYKEDLSQFKKATSAMITHLLQARGKVVKPTWKIHILACHVETFLDEKQVGLGIFCEQNVKAINDSLSLDIAQHVTKDRCVSIEVGAQ